MTSWTPPLFSMIDAMKPAFLASMIFSPEGAAVDLVLLLEPVESRFFFAGKSSSPYVSPQLSLKSNRLFNSKHLGFNSTHQGFNSKHPGFNSKHRGFNSKQWDLNSIRSWNNSGTKKPRFFASDAYLRLGSRRELRACNKPNVFCLGSAGRKT